MSEKEMKKEEFYKYLADLEKMSKTQLIMIKSVCEGLIGQNDLPGYSGDWFKPYTITTNNSDIPNCCKNCPSYKEGAVCCCVLPYLEQNRTGSPWPIRTVTTSNTDDININPNTIVTSGEYTPKVNAKIKYPRS